MLRGMKNYGLVVSVALAGVAAFGVTTAVGQDEVQLPRLSQPKKFTLQVDARNAKQLWGAVMNTVGPYDKKEKCWTLTARGNRFCMRPAKLAKGGAVSSEAYYFAISGQTYAADEERPVGVVMFISLSTSGYDKGLTFAGVDGLYQFGSRGSPPSDDNFKLVEIGAETYAWEVTDGFVGTGSESEVKTLIYAGGIENPKQKILARIDTYEGNESGTCMVDNVCFLRKIEYSFKPDGAGFYAIEMTLRRKSGTDTIFNPDDPTPVVQSPPFVIHFDPHEGRYKMPAKNMIDFLGKTIPTKASGGR